MKLKCNCGNTETFIGHQVVRMYVKVDSDGMFLEEDGDTSCYDSEDPYGPFTCVDCGAEVSN